MRRLFAGTAVFAAAVGLIVWLNAAPLPDSLDGFAADKPQFLDNRGEPLSVSYQNRFNVFDAAELYEIPDMLQKMFIAAEDKNFYAHHGVDWGARFAAVAQNVKAKRVVRGASTLTEQVVRMLHPRPRTLFSKIVEGADAWRLERRFAKDEILKFYLNQVPYAANRRGIKQAARYYFSKSPDRLSVREMTALVVLVRAPAAFNLYKYPEKTDKLIGRQLQKFYEQGIIDKEEFENAKNERVRLTPPALTVEAPQFLAFVKRKANGGAVKTTLDSALQDTVQKLTANRLKALKKKNVHAAAVLVLERETGNVLAWVSESADDKTKDYDAVLVPRQAASAQKPFLYALAMTKGWTDKTLLNDEPLSRSVGLGVHHFKNYSRRHYGRVTVRQALGNSLNIPAVKTIEFAGVGDYFDFLRKIGVTTLDKPPDFYREGLALGNAEIPLFELTRGYLMLANGGILKPVRATFADDYAQERVLPEAVALSIADILSDPLARQFEFGSDSVLNFPVKTAVKTGTSTDYRDAWAFGFNRDFVAGIWMGNLTYEPMRDVTGASGAGLLLRSVFSELNRMKNTGVLQTATMTGGKAGRAEQSEIFIAAPADGAMIALDPRVPDEYQAYRFELAGDAESVDWFVDGRKVGTGRSFFWKPVKGSHKVSAKAVLENGERLTFEPHGIEVK